MFVEIAGIPKGSQAEFALEWLETRVCPDVDLEAVFPRIEFAAVDTNMSSF